MALLRTATNFTMSLCVLNQWSLDFAGNTRRILRSIELSKQAGARYRLGPELELSGYGCEDHFHESDTYNHSWECMAKIIQETQSNPSAKDIICDIGMPVINSGVAYNCRVVVLNGRILLIRPKLVLADGGLHRESRWFTAWPHRMQYMNYALPEVVRQVTKDNQTTAAFGDALLHFIGPGSLGDVLVGMEMCEELWIGSPPHLQMYASGTDVIFNGSSSHHELRKLNNRIRLVQMASQAHCGGLYAYTNLRGCDSERICYDGGAMAALSGNLLMLGKQFDLSEVEINTLTVDLSSIRSRRIANKNFGRASAASQVIENNKNTQCYPTIEVPFSACQAANCSQPTLSPNVSRPSQTIMSVILSPEEEIAQGPSLWLWDILRRTRSSGFFLCLSGGLDSASVACLISGLCVQLIKAISEGNSDVLRTCSSLLNEPESNLRGFTARDLCSRLFYTCYMPSEHSSDDTKSRATRLADAIGSQHLTGEISSIVSSMLTTAVNSLQLPKMPQFTVNGGSVGESLALQNVQARTRMALAYLLAQLIPTQRNAAGGLLILSSANLDESLRGYFTKYDCSSADLNPIGSINKSDLRLFIQHCAHQLCKSMDAEHGKALSKVLLDILEAQPTAELMPLNSEGKILQTDEEDMGLTYNMLLVFGRLRKIDNCGPYSMLRCLLTGAWSDLEEDIPSDCFDSDGRPNERLAVFLCDKVQWFFRTYAVNRHKVTILPPSYHTESYSADDNRFDLRPFLYPVDWTHQFDCMKSLVTDWESQLHKTK